jgi:hypothetical protein
VEDYPEKNKAEEPAVTYGTGNKKITFFKSFEQAEEYGMREMASHTPEQRMEFLEILRKRFFHDRLVNGKWPPLKRIITIEKGTCK